MPVFELDDLTIEVPRIQLIPRLREALSVGRYERSEARALKMHLRPGDRVLELGGGCGYLSMVAARIVGGGNVVTVEANPDMIPVIETNFRMNDLPAGRLVHGAVMPGDAGGPVHLHVRLGFWSASLKPNGAPQERSVEVPSVGLDGLLAAHDPTVISLDIEGAEDGLFAAGLPPTVRLVVADLHPHAYGAAGMQRFFDCLSASGLAYCPNGSRGRVVVFERVFDA